MGRTRVIAAAAFAALLTAPAANAAGKPRDAVVESFDGAPIVAEFFPAAGLAEGARVPTVLLGHGWGGSHATDPEAKSSPTQGSIGVGALRKAGFNVLTWDARGFGGSGGEVNVDGPDFEAKDVPKLIDFVAQQPEARLDGPGDPRVGMAGSSYGGGIQLVTAGTGEGRLDAIVPDIAWHDLVDSLAKERVFKAGWGNLLYGVGVPMSAAPGLVSPAGLQSGTLNPKIHQGFREGTSTGTISDDTADWFRSRGPNRYVAAIRVPTLLTQGTIDTLFTLREAITNYETLKAAGVPVKMLWHCGGHGTCNLPAGKEGHVEAAVLAWFRHHLGGDPTVDTGPGFEWVADDGTWRSAPSWPAKAAAPIRATDEGGTLEIESGPGSGGSMAAAPADGALELEIPAPERERNVVGEPQLRFTYKGTGSPEHAHVFAQIVDAERDTVLDNQATPIPVVLDGAEHELTRPLEAVAAVAKPGSKLKLQLISGTQLYAPQRANGTLEVSSLSLELPVVVPGEAEEAAAESRPGAGGGPGAGERRARLSFGLPGSRGSKRGARRLVVSARATATITRVVFTLRTAKGRRIARSKALTLRGGRRVRTTLRLRSPLRRGAYRLEATWHDNFGERARAARRLRLG